jgi:hypothetical protein
MANKMNDVDSLHVEIDNLNNPLVGFCFIRDIDWWNFNEGSVVLMSRMFSKDSSALDFL